MQGKQKACAGGVEVEAGNILRQTQLLLQHACGRRNDVVARYGSDNAGTDFIGGDTGLFQGAFCCVDTKECMTLRGAVMPVLDAGAGGNPLVVGLHDFGHVVIGDNVLRNTAAGAPDFDSVHSSSFWGAAAPIFLNFW